jgi:hypothetical protein
VSLQEIGRKAKLNFSIPHLKKLATLYRNGTISYKDAVGFINNFHGYMNHLNAHRTMQSMDKLFNKLFIEYFTKGGQYYEQISVTQ